MNHKNLTHWFCKKNKINKQFNFATVYLFICFSMTHNVIFNWNYNNTNNYKYFSFDINIKKTLCTFLCCFRIKVTITPPNSELGVALIMSK